MDPHTAATRVPDPDAVEFIRFCYRRRRVGWPELYDEMCAVAGRGAFRGYGSEDLAALGIGFSLFDMPALAALANQIVAEELALRRPVTVVLAPADDLDVEASIAADVTVTNEAVLATVAVIAPEAIVVSTPDPVLAPELAEPLPTPHASFRLAGLPVGA
jgi:hypothetical protein